MVWGCDHLTHTENDDGDPTMMTAQQHKLLTFINGYTTANGYSPSFAEMADGIGQKSKSSIDRLVRGLEERGLLRRRANRARLLEVVKPDEPSSLVKAAPALFAALQAMVEVWNHLSDDDLMDFAELHEMTELHLSRLLAARAALRAALGEGT